MEQRSTLVTLGVKDLPRSTAFYERLGWRRSMPNAEGVAFFQAGGTLVKPAYDIFWGGYVGFFADPDGFLREVAWNPMFPLTEDGAILLPA